MIISKGFTCVIKHTIHSNKDSLGITVLNIFKRNANMIPTHTNGSTHAHITTTGPSMIYLTPFYLN